MSTEPGDALYRWRFWMLVFKGHANLGPVAWTVWPAYYDSLILQSSEFELQNLSIKPSY